MKNKETKELWRSLSLLLLLRLVSSSSSSTLVVFVVVTMTDGVMVSTTMMTTTGPLHCFLIGDEGSTTTQTLISKHPPQVE